MKEENTIKKNTMFRKVYKKARYYVDDYLVLYVLKNGHTYNKTGYSVSKKVGNSVIRNRVKRLMKENFRLLSPRLKEGYYIVFVARVKSKDADYYRIKESMEKLFKRAKLIKN